MIVGRRNNVGTNVGTAKPDVGTRERGPIRDTSSYVTWERPRNRRRNRTLRARAAPGGARRPRPTLCEAIPSSTNTHVGTGLEWLPGSRPRRQEAREHHGPRASLPGQLRLRSQLPRRG